MFRQSSPGTQADTETVIRQALGRSRGSKEAGRRSGGGGGMMSLWRGGRGLERRAWGSACHPYPGPLKKIKAD